MRSTPTGVTESLRLAFRLKPIRSVQSCSHLARVHFMDTSPDRHQSVMPLCKEFPQHGYIEEVKFPGHRDGAETLAWLQAVRRDCPRFGRGRRAKSQAFDSCESY